MNPSSGSLYGGTVINILGNGFDTKENTFIKIGNSNCTLTALNSSMLTCITPQNIAGTYQVQIKLDIKSKN